MLNTFFLPISLHALAPITSCFIAGIFWQHGMPWIYVCIFTVLSFFLVFGFVGSQKPKSKKAIIFALILIISFVAGAIRHLQITNHFENLRTQVDGKVMDLVGRVIEIQHRPSRRHSKLITVSIEFIKEPNKREWRQLPMTIQLYTSRKLPISYYDRLLISGIKFKIPKHNSYFYYLMKEGIIATLFPKMEQIQVIIEPENSTIYCWLRKWSEFRDDIRYRIRKKCSSQTFSLFSTLFLGNRQVPKKFLSEQKEKCKWWGISHHLARSGLHLVIFIAVLAVVLNMIPLSFFIKQFVLLTIILVYASLSWPSISFWRALLTFLLYKLCAILDLPIQFLHLVLLVTLLVLIYNPLQLFFLDFQLSFGLTLALAWLNYANIQRKNLHLP